MNENIFSQNNTPDPEVRPVTEETPVPDPSGAAGIPSPEAEATPFDNIPSPVLPEEETVLPEPQEPPQPQAPLPTPADSQESPPSPQTTPEQPYGAPIRDPRGPVYGNVPNPYGTGAPYTPPGQIPLQRNDRPPYSQGNPYGNPGYPPGQGGYSYGNGGYYPGNQSSPYRTNGMGGVPPTQFYGSGNPSPKKDPKNKKSKNWLLALLIAGCVLIGTISGLVIANLTGPSDPVATPTEKGPAQIKETTEPTVQIRPTEAPRETQPLATASGDQMTLNQIYNQNVPAIVGITNEFTQNVFGQSASSASTGSGFIISSDGEILTNYHVVEGAERLTVTLYDGREYPATLVGYEAESDVALIKIEAEGLPVCAIGDSDQVYVGEQIAAIGNPMGELTYTMTVGYVSAMDRFVNTDGTPISMIQVDAAINPGNSGGPVFNLYGEVIGIATAKYSGTLSDGATLEGLGFAIPINDIVEILNDLRVSGKVPDRAYMGVMVSMLPLDKETYGVDHGVFVQSVDEGGSAYKAGVQANDIILKIGDVELNAYENLQQTLRGYRAGDETTITVYRNGETITLPIVFDAKPDTTDTTTATNPQYTEPVDPTEPEATEDPWGEFPWGDFPWGDFGG